MQVDVDVMILGSGLAGSTLALQLTQITQGAKIAVVERTTRPLPEAAHKVGESCVEVSSHYFGEVLGLGDYFRAEHLKKNGLRFLSGNHRGPLAARPEIGPAEFPIVPSFQLDRGKVENDLRARIESEGVELIEGVSVRDVSLGEEGAAHEVHLSDGRTLKARWVVDATGRRRLLQKKLGLRRPSPQKASASWFRIARRVKIEELVPEDERSWHARDIDGNRWLSTIHLMGPGYWVWVIPLATGYTSFGIVADASHHGFETFNKPDRARAWLEEHEPVLAAFLEGVPLEDFRVMHDYSYLTERTLDTDRWAMVGEASAFVDPLYSLGSDFIAMANCYAARAIADELGEGLDPEVVEELNQIFVLLTTDAARTLSGNGDIFPHGDVLGAKLWWDFYNYWSFMSAHFFQGIWREDAATLRRFRDMGQKYWALNTVAQQVLEAWAALKPAPHGDGRKQFVPLPMFPSVLADQHVALEEKLDAEATFAKMERDLEVGRQLVTELVVHALRDLGEEKANEYFARAKLDESGLELDARAAVDALPRRERLDQLPRIGRDLERALGRPKSALTTPELLERARR